MAYNPFIGRDQVWLEAKLSELQEQLGDGKTIVQSAAGDASATERLNTSVQASIEQILAALYLLDQAGAVNPPGKYPANASIRARRTTPRYIWGA